MRSEKRSCFKRAKREPCIAGGYVTEVKGGIKGKAESRAISRRSDRGSGDVCEVFRISE